MDRRFVCRLGSIVLALILVLGLPMVTPPEAAEGLPKGLACSFRTGSSITYGGGLYRTSRASISTRRRQIS